MNKQLGRFAHRLTLVAIAAALLVVPSPVTRALGAILLVGLIPGLVVSTRMGVRAVPAAGIATVLSPIMLGLLALALISAGVRVDVASWIAAGFLSALYLVVGRGVPGGSDDTDGNERRVAIGLLIVVGLAAVLALSLPLTNAWWRVREDSWFHAAVFNRLSNHGLPLVDPYFSPLRLQYVYFYHVILNAAATFAHVDAFHAMIIVNVVALVACVFGFDTYARHFAPRARPRVLGAAVVVFGMNGLFYLFYPIRLARAFVGDSSGGAVLSHFFSWSPAGHDTALRLLSIEGNQVLFLDKFMLGTAISLTFGMVFVLLALLVGARRGLWSRWHDPAWVLVVAGLLYTHVVVGVVALVATLVLLALLLLIRSHPADGGPEYSRLVLLTLGAVALAVPYAMSLSANAGGGAQLSFALQPWHLVGLLSAVLPALVLAVPFLRWTARPEDEPGDRTGGEVVTGRLYGQFSLSATGIVVMWFALVLAMALFVDLPANNETKFAFLLFMPATGLAAGGLWRLSMTPRGRATAIGLVIACTVPLNAIYFYHAFRDGTEFAIADENRAAYDWLRKNTPVDALVIDADDVVDVPVLAVRDIYWGGDRYAIQWGYPPEAVANRRALRDSVYSENGLSVRQLETLRSLDRPVFVIVRGVQFDNYELFRMLRQDPMYTGRFVAGEIGVFELDLDAAVSPPGP